MKTIVVFLQGAMAFFAFGANAATVSFANGAKSNYEGNTCIAVGESADGFVVTCTRAKPCCTAWGCRSERIAIPSGSTAFSLSFEIRALEKAWLQPNSSGKTWYNAIHWLNASGEILSRRLLNIEFKPSAFEKFTFSGDVPPESAYAEIGFGVDARPTVLPKERIEVRHVSFDFFPEGVKPPEKRKADLRPPLVTSHFESPSTDAKLSVRYAITDDTAVDWGTVSVTDRVHGAAIPFSREGNVITLLPGAPWAAGVHRLSVSARDVVGNAAVSEKAFLIGEGPKARHVMLRDDGIVLLDGTPFYPVGIYGIKPHAFNGNSFDMAIRELMAAGFNAGHAYRYRWDADFLSAAEKNGMKLWTDGKCALDRSDFFIDSLRHNPSTIAWYIGDDTSMNTTPGQLKDRDEACRMLDGTRVTCHADGVRSGAAKSNLEEYVNHADVFMAEMYPFDNTHDERCVAEVCRDMDRCWEDMRQFGDGRRPHGVWAILQCFHGKSWRRYPTSQEMYATSFAAVIHGATGITWFHYAGQVEDPKKGYSGMFRTPEDWSAMTNIAHRIAALAPVLLERTPPQPPEAEIVFGPKRDDLGQPTVTALLKNHKSDVYLLAVNAKAEKVRAKFRLNLRAAVGKVAWERRDVRLSRGEFEDDFEPLEVHVYRFRESVQDTTR